LTRLYLIWQLDEEFAEIEKSLEQQDYINLIHSITGKMEADLEVIRQKNELLNNGQLSDWIDNGTDETEKSRKQKHVMRLMKKMDGLQKQMAEAKRGYLG
jgi:vacuolar-type H+-ATPase catalytic subunit A/Vma1